MTQVPFTPQFDPSARRSVRLTSNRLGVASEKFAILWRTAVDCARPVVVLPANTARVVPPLHDDE